MTPAFTVVVSVLSRISEAIRREVDIDIKFKKLINTNLFFCFKSFPHHFLGLLVTINIDQKKFDGIIDANYFIEQ